MSRESKRGPVAPATGGYATQRRPVGTTSMHDNNRTLWAESALLTDGWAQQVAIRLDAQGNIAALTPNTPRQNAQALPGSVIPGIPNLHSHAHQRAIAGLCEYREPADGGNHFWSWRKTMYHYLQRIQPQQLYDIARMLYLEMLQAGYTSVAEFQYLHHDPAGRRYAEPAEMTLQCLHAAADVGIGFTALPVLYQYGGFGQAAPLDSQKRFLNDVDGFCEIAVRLAGATRDDANMSCGIAPHSLRAVSAQRLQAVLDNLADTDTAVVHLHIAEQPGEVEDCIAWSGQRPVEWLYAHFPVDASWCLVHATHISDTETRLLANSGAVVGLCPTTEANLGDGCFNALPYAAQGGIWGIGSDSHISINPMEELRWYEYGLRLRHRRRNLLASAQQPHTGQCLLEAAVLGGARACARAIGEIAVGARADFIVLDDHHPRLTGRRDARLLDSLIFSTSAPPLKQVWVGGRRLIDDGVHPGQADITAAFRRTVAHLTAA